MSGGIGGIGPTKPKAHIDGRDIYLKPNAFTEAGGLGELRNNTAVISDKAGTVPHDADFLETRRIAVASQKAQLSRFGITDDQRDEAHSFLSERIYQAIRPGSYNDIWERVRNIFSKNPERRNHNGFREDTWRVYLGLPQVDNTLAISDHAPPTTTDPTATFFRINSERGDRLLVSRTLRFERKLKVLAERGGEQGETAKRVMAQNYYADLDGHPARRTAYYELMAGFLVGHDEDAEGEYISYYDFWDLDLPIFGQDKENYNRPKWDITVPVELAAGNPIEFYARIRFDHAREQRIIDLENDLVTRWLKRSHPEMPVAEIREHVLMNGMTRKSEWNVEQALQQMRPWALNNDDSKVQALVRDLFELSPRHAADFAEKREVETETRGRGKKAA